ncbi:3904_t:CDS:2 [Ambispora gerdemannii]|uniref:3904_t:CDS:1 n=1 Tax=Ambispora gerdemannii TaxID=144530 RepID=A0A9N8WC54_9GLOM|nr:3904_t:CDS:2 [Ambispora gerdemannii]
MSETSTTLLHVRNYPRPSKVHKRNSLNSHSKFSQIFSKLPRAVLNFDEHSSLSSTRRGRTLSLDSVTTTIRPENNSMSNDKYFSPHKNEEASTAMMSFLLGAPDFKKSKEIMMPAKFNKYSMPKIQKPKPKYRFILAEAPKEILEEINDEKFKSSATIMAISSILNDNTQSPQTSQNRHKNRVHSRKNPYPVRSLQSSEAITFKLDTFKLKPPPPIENQEIPNTINFSSHSSAESSAPASPRLEPKKKQQNIKSPRPKREGVMKVKQRRRKGNSLARVLADSGIIESPFVQLGSTLEVNGEIKPLRLPLAPQMEFSKLLKELRDLSLDSRGLSTQPVMTWKTGPLSIEHLAHFNELHPTEAYVASVLRLTPVQYFNAKHSLITASRRYEGRTLPFRKSDAQKILRIDVNKASKLWEFFHQLNWL